MSPSTDPNHTPALFTDPPARKKPATKTAPMTAGEVKDKLRRRYPATQAMGARQVPGPWTVIEEYACIDLLAIGATGATRYAWVGHEVKVSRSDLRRELLRPWKREPYKALCHELYLAIPAGLLTPDEIAYKEPAWPDGAFDRTPCPGAAGFPCQKPRGKKAKVDIPRPSVFDTSSDYDRRVYYRDRIVCPTCDGKGHTGVSHVEREAPTCWIPADLGLITVDRRGTRIVKPAPHRLISTEMKLRDIGALVRWVSARPDPRHLGVVEAARETSREFAALRRGAA